MYSPTSELARNASAAAFSFLREQLITYIEEFIIERGEIPDEQSHLTWMDVMHVLTGFCAHWSRDEDREDNLDTLFSAVETALHTYSIVNGIEFDDHASDDYCQAAVYTSRVTLLEFCQWVMQKNSSYRYPELVKTIRSADLETIHKI
jgi:hypothetical protein